MRNKKRFAAIVLLVIAALCLIHIISSTKISQLASGVVKNIASEVRPGQVWIYETDNPFESDSYSFVIETKDGYVKYCQLKYKNHKHRDIFERSSSERFFKSNKKLKTE